MLPEQLGALVDALRLKPHQQLDAPVAFLSDGRESVREMLGVRIPVSSRRYQLLAQGYQPASIHHISGTRPPAR